MTKNGVAKIGDMGVCRVCKTDATGCNTKIGTPIVMSPEQLSGEVYGRKTDIWSLGIILYQLCALTPPFSADSLPALARKIKKGDREPIPKQYGENMRTLIDSLLTMEKSKRPNIDTVLQFPKIWDQLGNLIADK